MGVVHPCKVYGAMAMSRPILLVGPQPCHASEILDETGSGWHIAHGDVEGAAALLRQIIQTPESERTRMGRAAHDYIATRVSKHRLCGNMCDTLESAAQHSQTPVVEPGAAQGGNA